LALNCRENLLVCNQGFPTRCPIVGKHPLYPLYRTSLSENPHARLQIRISLLLSRLPNHSPHHLGLKLGWSSTGFIFLSCARVGLHHLGAPTPDGFMQFTDLQLNPQLQRAIAAAGYTVPTPIQQQAIPIALTGRDVLGCAQTGTGKTAAFALPILHRMMAERPVVAVASSMATGSSPHSRGRRPIRCLVLTPTRELALQIGESFATYGRNSGLTHTVIFGGVGQRPQVDALRRGIDTVIACPGRLLDLMNQGHVDLNNLSIFVLDEADRMLDMGFIHDIRKIVARIPQKRQTLFFSATMPESIRSLADSLLHQPAKVSVAPVSSAAETVQQSVCMISKGLKPELLNHFLQDNNWYKVLVFTRTKHGADKVERLLNRNGHKSAAIHGNKSQNARVRAINEFRDGDIRVLVASDIAARGLDIDGITHVVNFDVPHEPETYVHRIGRTGRAGASGEAVSFCDVDERTDLRAIERLIRKPIAVVDHPFIGKQAPPRPAEDARPPRQNYGGQPRSRQGQGSGQRKGQGDKRYSSAPPRHQNDRREQSGENGQSHGQRNNNTERGGGAKGQRPRQPQRPRSGGGHRSR
jgi:ATP-dependent RNA helicase RhlE